MPIDMKYFSRILSKEFETKDIVKPWGFFRNLWGGKKWHLKTLHINAGKRLSLQHHKNRTEYWMLVRGDAIASIEKNGVLGTIVLGKGRIVKVPRQALHRLESKNGGVLVEVCFGYFDENDIVRFEDDYGRV